MRPQHFFELFIETAYTTPQAAALSSWKEQSAPVSYAELASASEQVAIGLTNLGFQNKPVVISLPTGPEFVATFIGCLMAGVYAAPAPMPHMPTNKERFISILKTLGPNTPVIGDTGDTGAFKLDLESLHGSSFSIQKPQAEDVAFLQFSSGSTGTPQAIAISHENLAANIAQIQHSFCTGSSRRCVTWLPHFHDMGLVGTILAPLALNFEVVQMSPESFLRAPWEWLRAISDGGPSIAGAPNFGYAHCNKYIREGIMDELDLSNWEVAFCGAELIQASVLEEFVNKFAPQKFSAQALLPCYGMAEATLLVSAGCWSGNGKYDVIPVGKPVPGTRLTLRPHIDAPEGCAEIYISGPQVVNKFWSAKTNQIETIEADKSGEFWHGTGDTGYIRDEQLFIVDRLKDIIIMKGKNIAAADIETIATQDLSYYGGIAAFSTGSPERLYIIFELPKPELRSIHCKEIAALMSSNIWQKLGLLATILVTRRGGLPRTSSGKVRRHAVRRAFVKGEYDGQEE